MSIYLYCNLYVYGLMILDLDAYSLELPDTYKCVRWLLITDTFVSQPTSSYRTVWWFVVHYGTHTQRPGMCPGNDSVNIFWHTHALIKRCITYAYICDAS